LSGMRAGGIRVHGAARTLCPTRHSVSIIRRSVSSFEGKATRARRLLQVGIICRIRSLRDSILLNLFPECLPTILTRSADWTPSDGRNTHLEPDLHLPWRKTDFNGDLFSFLGRWKFGLFPVNTSRTRQMHETHSFPKGTQALLLYVGHQHSRPFGSLQRWSSMGGCKLRRGVAFITKRGSVIGLVRWSC
jgi:hypothetical protein